MTPSCWILAGICLVVVASIPTGTYRESCPKISGCSSCDNCSLTVNGTGGIECTVGSSATLHWEVDSSGGFTVTILSDAMSDSIQIEYTPLSCDAEASVICVADESVQSLEQSSSWVTLFTEPCVPMDSIEYPYLMKVLLAVLLVLLTVAAAVGVLCYWRRSTKTGFIPQRLELEVTEREQSSGKTLSRREFVKLLCRGYNERGLPVQSLQLDSDGIVDFDEDVSYCEIRDLLDHELWDINQRIMFIADVGYGKTTFFRHVIHRWIANKTGDYILLYLSLGDVAKDAYFLDEVIEMLPPEIDEIKNLEELLGQNPCIVLLDGLNEFSFFQELVSFGEQLEYRTPGERLLSTRGPRIVDLLEGKHHEYPQLRLWVTTRQKSTLRGGFSEPFCAVHMKGVPKAQKLTYIEQLRSGGEIHADAGASASHDFSTIDGDGHLMTQFLKLTGTKDLSFFIKSPMIFSILSQEHALNNPLLHSVTKLNYTALVQVTLNILEYRFQQKIPNTSFEDEIERIHSGLCKVALKQTMWKTTQSRADNEISQRQTEIALLIGHLKLATSSIGSPSDIAIKFSHDFFQEYFTAWALELMENSPSWLQEKLKTPETLDQKTGRLLKFLFGFGSYLVDKITDDLIKTKQWDLLVDCIHELPSDDRMGDLLVKLHQKKLVLNLDDTEFHFDAITDLCVNCSVMKIKLKAIHLIKKSWNDEAERLISRVQNLHRNVRVLES